MVSAQQANLLPENASRNDIIFPNSLYCIYRTTSQCLSSHGFTITMVYSNAITAPRCNNCNTTSLLYYFYNQSILILPGLCTMCVPMYSETKIYDHDDLFTHIMFMKVRSSSYLSHMQREIVVLKGVHTLSG